jgi:hypothetical protein
MMTLAAQQRLSRVLMLANTRRIAIGEILDALAPEDAQQAATAVVQRLSQYRDERPAAMISGGVSVDEFQAAIDQVIEDVKTAQAAPRWPRREVR